MSGLDVREFLAGYVAEADEQLSLATTRLLALEAAMRRGEHDHRATRDLYRALHTLKGLSSMVGAEPIVEIAHVMESVVRAADQGAARLPLDAVDVLLRGIRAMEQRVRAVADGQPVPPAPRSLLDEIADIPLENDPARLQVELSLDPELAAKLTPNEREQLLEGMRRGRRAARVDFFPSAEKAGRGVGITSVRERLGFVAELVKVVPRTVTPSADAPSGLAFTLLVLTDVDDAALAAAASTDPAFVVPITPPPLFQEELPHGLEERPRAGFVRVDVARLDAALERLSALVVSRFRLQRALGALARGEGDLRAVQAIADESGRELRDLRAASMRARMVPVPDLLDRAPLIVRGLAQASHKQVRLVIEAGHAELDKAVGERLLPAIVHLLRNAVDHAIEPPDERERAGKPPEGLLRVVATERGSSQLELAISDDGRGIDRETLARRAGTPVPRSATELAELLSRPGLSTLDAATTVSGRGMGMNIVRRVVVDELAGELLAASELGRGTTFTLRIPLSVTIVDAFRFAAGGEQFVTPVAAVADLADLEARMITQVPAGHARAVPMLSHRGAVMPLVALDSLLHLPSQHADRPKAIIVKRTDREPMAFGVDRMLGQQEVVVRPLSDPLAHAPGVVGSTDLGDGRPTLVLDLPALTRGLEQATEARP